MSHNRGTRMDTKVQVDQFKQLVKDNSLSHGYILHGPDTNVQFAFARHLATYLETGKWSEPERLLSDALFIDGSKVELGIDVSRSFSEFLYRKSAVSSRRTLVVNNATDFTPQAINALLKIAEEPPANSLIILTVHELGALLPTLLSRFQKVYFSGGAGPTHEFSEIEKQAGELVEKFLMSNEKGKSEIIKEITADDKEVEKEANILDTFSKFLLIELAKKPEENWRALKHLLARTTAMNDYSTNKKLQLEAVIPFIK